MCSDPLDQMVHLWMTTFTVNLVTLVLTSQLLTISMMPCGIVQV